MNRTRSLVVVLLAIAITATAPASAFAQCSYDISFSRTASGDVRIQATSDCRFYTEHQTFLSLESPSFAFASDYGSTVVLVVGDAPGSQSYCASTYATYWEGSILALDSDSGYECASF